MRTAATLATLALALALLARAAGAEPLPGWRDAPARKRLLEFVTTVTTPGGAGYVTPVERIAVFDDDGTLWPEKPRAQGMFALQRLRTLAGRHPEWRTQLPYAGALELGDKYFQEAGEADTFQLLATAYAGRTQDDFRQDARAYFATARHPRYDRPFTQLAYGPMRELVSHLRANGFRVFVTSAGSVELARILAGEMFGIPPDDVLGSSVVSTLREEDGGLVLRRLATVHGLNDGPVKPLTVDAHVGGRPILVVGNVGSGGDIPLLRYSRQGGRLTLQVLVRHDDFEREYAYDEPDGASLKAANEQGWLVVSMRHDWLRVFGAE
jgi:phosphoserine phosphatase